MTAAEDIGTGTSRFDQDSACELPQSFCNKMVVTVHGGLRERNYSAARTMLIYSPPVKLPAPQAKPIGVRLRNRLSKNNA